MANKFYGKIGFAEPIDDGTGKYMNGVTERYYYGDVLKANPHMDSGNKRNEDIVLRNEISVIADPYALNHCGTMRYVELMGALWKVESVREQFPRLLITIGGVYNGDTASTGAGDAASVT